VVLEGPADISLKASGVIHGPVALTAYAYRCKLLQVDHRQELPGKIIEPELAAVEFLDVGLEEGLQEAGEAESEIHQSRGVQAVHPVEHSSVIVAGLGPLPLVGESPLQTIVAAKFVPMVLVVFAEDLVLFRNLIISAIDLGVIVVLALVQRIDEVVEPLVEDV